MVHWILKHEKKVLACAIATYIIVLSIVGIIKYQNFGYNSLDLGIYNQVYYKTSHGDWFGFSIHPHSYLGDHFEPLILLLSTLYRVAPHPITLIVLQTVALGLIALPIYAITKRWLNGGWPLGLAMMSLLNPFLHSMNLYEFHMLVFLPILTLTTVYYYLREKFLLFSLFLFFATVVREDAVSVTMMLGVIAGIDAWRSADKKTRWHTLWQRRYWILVPFIMGILWYGTALWVTRTHSLNNGYKYAIYYAWFGNSIQEVVRNIVTHPIQMVSHYVTAPNVTMIIGLLMPFLFLPILRPKYLLLSLVPLIEITSTEIGGGELILNTHYVALFLPGLVVAFLFAVKSILHDESLPRFLRFFWGDSKLLILVLLITTVYTFVMLSPIAQGIMELRDMVVSEDRRSQINAMMKEIQPSDALVTTYNFLPRLSSRDYVYSLNYLSMGRTQYSVAPFPKPARLNAAFIDFDELILQDLQYRDKPLYEPYLDQRSRNLRNVLSPLKVSEVYDNVVLFGSEGKPLSTLVEKITDIRGLNMIVLPSLEEMNLELVGYAMQEKIMDKDSQQFDFIVAWKSRVESLPDLQLKIFFHENGHEVSRIIPIAYGLYETSEWNLGELYKIFYALRFPKDTESIQLQLVRIEKGTITLSELKSLKNYFQKVEDVGPRISLSL